MLSIDWCFWLFYVHCFQIELYLHKYTCTHLYTHTAYITQCEVHSVYKRAVDKRYVYMILVEWSDGTQYTVRRTYGDFFSFHTKVCTYV